jgi:hypothetical protein
MKSSFRAAAALFAAIGLTGIAAAGAAPPAEIRIPGTGIFPESLTSARDGSIYIGSVGKAQVYRVAPGSDTAEVFIKPGTAGLREVFGVLADDRTGTLWVCSNLRTQPTAGPAVPSELHAFDLATGASKARHVFPAGGMCNDIAVGGNGSTYATDTPGMQVLRLPKGGDRLEVWAGNGAFGPAGGILDGIAVVDGRVIVNTLATSKLWAINIRNDGSAGRIDELQLSSPVTRPDGMRPYGGKGLLTTDSTGKIQRVVIRGRKAEVTTLKEGLEGVVSVTVVGDMAYALEGQLGILMARPGAPPAPAEKPFRAVGIPLKPL